MNNKILWLTLLIVLVYAAWYFTRTDDVVISVVDGDITEKQLSVDDGDEESVSEAASAPAAQVSPLTPPPTTPTPIPSNTSAYDDEGNVIVRYTANGFTPSTVEIEPGDAVVFINEAILPMWVKAQAHPTAEYFEYASLNQGRSAYKGEEYIFTFTQSGTWGYMNLNKESHKGVVIVSN